MTHCRRWLLAVVFTVLPAIAEAAVPIALEIDGDVPVPDPDAVRRLVELNLHTTAEEVPSPNTTRIHVLSVGRSTLARIDVDDPVTGKMLSRAIDLLALGKNGANRLLAAAITELVAASWAELEVNPKPVAQPVGESASLQTRQDALAAVRSLDRPWTQVGVMGGVLGPFDGAGLLPGGGLRIVPALGKRLRLPIDLLYARGARNVALGELDLDVLAADVGLAYQWQWSRVGLRAGLGARGGAVRYRGSPSSGDAVGATVWSPWASPMLGVSAFILPSSRVAAELLLNGGYALTRTRAGIDQARDVGLEGFWVGAGLAIGLRAEH